MKQLQQFTTMFRNNENTATNRRLRPLFPKLHLDLKTFIRPPHTPNRKSAHESYAQATAQGGTRWNPTAEQIGILEMLYCKGMRTPNARQIECITLRLSQYGKIEGKNVFYWFQNHKARDRQKQKRTSLTEEAYEDTLYEKKCRLRGFDDKPCIDGEGDANRKTLKLFPLHPERRD